jgi:small subunit ribosomal protein S3
VGQKASPYALRLGLNQPWQSNYFPPKKEQANWLQQDGLIRDYLYSHFPEITEIEIERTEGQLFVFIHSPNSSLIAGESNDNLDKILAKVSRIVQDKKIVTKLELIEERNIYTSPRAIANYLARQLENRVAWPLLLRNLLKNIAREKEVKGIKIKAKGRLGGVAIAQHKLIIRGRMPSSTLVSSIKEGTTEANTAYGKIGITVEIYKGKKKKLKYVNTNTKKN